MDNQKTGSIRDWLAAKNLSTPDRAKALRAHDQWSQVHIKLTKNNLQHWLNNNLVLELDNKMIRANAPAFKMMFLNQGSKLCVRSIKYRSLD